MRAKATVQGCTVTGGRDQLVLAYVGAELTGSRFNGAGDDAISVKGGSASLSSAEVAGALGTGLKLDENAEVVVNSTTMSSGKNTVSVAEGSVLRIKDASLVSEFGACIDVDALHVRHGGSRVELTHVNVSGSKVPFNIGKGEQVVVDGKIIGPTEGTTGQ